MGRVASEELDLDLIWADLNPDLRSESETRSALSLLVETSRQKNGADPALVLGYIRQFYLDKIKFLEEQNLDQCSVKGIKSAFDRADHPVDPFAGIRRSARVNQIVGCTKIIQLIESVSGQSAVFSLRPN